MELALSIATRSRTSVHPRERPRRANFLPVGAGNAKQIYPLRRVEVKKFSLEARPEEIEAEEEAAVSVDEEDVAVDVDEDEA